VSVIVIVIAIIFNITKKAKQRQASSVLRVFGLFSLPRVTQSASIEHGAS
jgi:hypothetical protein